MKQSKPTRAPTDKQISPWRNRIVGNAQVSPQDLIANDKNYRRHSPAQRAALIGAIDDIGYVRSITVNKRTGRIIDGHLRLDLALEQGQTTIPVEYVDLSDEEEALALATLDPIAAMATASREALASLLENVEVHSAGVRAMLEGLAQQNGILLTGLGGTANGLTDPDAIPEPPDEPITRPGDLWILGQHRLLCGDSSKAEEVDRLLGGEPIHLVNSDPPYGVRLEPRSNNAICAGKSSFEMTHHQKLDVSRNPSKAKPTAKKLRAKDRPLANDFLPKAEFDKLLDAWFANFARALLPGRTFCLWGGFSNCGNYPRALEANGLYFSQAIIWDKQHPVLTHKDYMGAHEWCFYGWREGAAHQFFGPPNVTDLWHVKKVDPQSMVHLTEKPVELAVRALLNSSRPGENVLDLFGGSGSTLIAAEQTGRRTFLMELDGLYADIIVRRWEQFTGNKAVCQPASPPQAGQLAS